jgi:hypothetical protein
VLHGIDIAAKEKSSAAADGGKPSHQLVLSEAKRIDSMFHKFKRPIATADVLARESLGVSWSDSLDATWLMYGIKERCARVADIKDHQP